jgi:hypothetical protein
MYILRFQQISAHVSKPGSRFSLKNSKRSPSLISLPPEIRSKLFLIFINMRTWILLFLLIAHAEIHAATVLSQGARNVKNGAPYGGASAIGDGVHDDTQAFLDALNIGMNVNGNASPIAPIYVPPGNYLISKQLILWVPGFMFGEPSNPPTLVLKSGSLTNSSSPIPFVVTLSSYNHRPYDTNWNVANAPGFASTNNTFHYDLLNINFTVQSNNPGCSDVVLWQTAQRVSFRNSIMSREDSVNNCYRQDNNGGGGTMQNLTCNGGANAAVISNTSQAFYRGCTFNGPVLYNGYWVTSFLACRFNNPGGKGFTCGGGAWFGMDDCTFTSGTPFNPGGRAYHLENTTLSPGQIVQLTSDSVYYNGVSTSGSSTILNSAVRGSACPNPPLPQPTSACVNVKSFGAKGDGSTDDTAAILAAYANDNEVYFPPGNYITSRTITLDAGKKMFGAGATAFSQITGSSNPVINTTGNGTGIGVIMENIGIANGPATGSCMTWNADPASQIVSCQFQQVNATAKSPPRVLFQSGGAIWDESWVPSDSPNGSQPTCFVVSCAGPLFLYAVAPEHYSGPVIIINNAKNLWAKQLQYEYTTDQSLSQINQITNSTNINITGAIVGGATAPAVFNISDSTCNIFGPVWVRGTLQNGVIKKGTNYFGPNGQFAVLAGYGVH